MRACVRACVRARYSLEGHNNSIIVLNVFRSRSLLYYKLSCGLIILILFSVSGFGAGPRTSDDVDQLSSVAYTIWVWCVCKLSSLACMICEYDQLVKFERS